MLRDLVNAQAIAAIIVIDPDRLSRKLGHQLLLAEAFEQASVRLLIVSHPLEQGPEGWLFFQMRGALAEYERAKSGVHKRGTRGVGKCPLGIGSFANRTKPAGRSTRKKTCWSVGSLPCASRVCLCGGLRGNSPQSGSRADWTADGETAARRCAPPGSGGRTASIRS